MRTRSAFRSQNVLDSETASPTFARTTTRQPCFRHGCRGEVIGGGSAPPHPTLSISCETTPRIALSGISDPRSGISGGSVVEGWVRKPEDIDDLIADHLLLPNIAGHVVLHFGRNIDGPVPIGLVMADLADWNGPREDGEVTRLVTRT